MKVCTDSCIFGAWAAPDKTTENILDIGTGTGLLSLMLAQKSQARIDAVEFDSDASIQAQSNFLESPWKERLQLIHQDIKQYQTSILYDLIICNPPFYDNYLKSDNLKYNIALHSENLKQDELLEKVLELLKPDGSFYILLPEKEFRNWEKMAETKHLFLQQSLSVKHHQTSAVFRIAGKFSNIKNTTAQKETLIIKEKTGEYTPKFISLLKDYYLYL